jgi:phospholipid/cholesterol/gamma-HCH transport system substrate-binding protein
MSRDLKVGALIIVSLIVASAAIFLVGERSNIFARKNDYFVHFETVGGLATGNPVQLNGVIVGSVQKVVLPEDVEEQYLTVWISIDRRFADRVREDSRARIKTLGLLGDKYVDLTSGSPGFAQIESGGEIRTGAATDVEKIIATGGDAVENLVAISYSLRTILERMEAGEGILGELTTESETGTRAKKSLVETFETFRDITAKLESGLGRQRRKRCGPPRRDFEPGREWRRGGGGPAQRPGHPRQGRKVARRDEHPDPGSRGAGGGHQGG